MVEIGERYRHYKSTGGIDHTYEIVNKALFQGDKAEDMGKVVVGVPTDAITSGAGAIILFSQDLLHKTLAEGEIFERKGKEYTVTNIGIFQVNKQVHDQEEVIIYKALYEISDFPPDVSVIVRCTSEFIGNVLVGQQEIPRFTKEP